MTTYLRSPSDRPDTESARKEIVFNHMKYEDHISAEVLDIRPEDSEDFCNDLKDKLFLIRRYPDNPMRWFWLVVLVHSCSCARPKQDAKTRSATRRAETSWVT